MKKIVVVGSGINGLVAANYLVKNNFEMSVAKTVSKPDLSKP